MNYDEILQFTELQRRVVVLEQKASDDSNMVLKKAPNFANRLVEAFGRIETLEVRTHTDIEDLGARLTGMEGGYQELSTSHSALCDVVAKIDHLGRVSDAIERARLSQGDTQEAQDDMDRARNIDDIGISSIPRSDNVDGVGVDAVTEEIHNELLELRQTHFLNIKLFLSVTRPHIEKLVERCDTNYWKLKHDAMEAQKKREWANCEDAIKAKERAEEERDALKQRLESTNSQWIEAIRGSL